MYLSVAYPQDIARSSPLRREPVAGSRLGSWTREVGMVLSLDAGSVHRVAQAAHHVAGNGTGRRRWRWCPVFAELDGVVDTIGRGAGR
jgi:hypothetical protein